MDALKTAPKRTIQTAAELADDLIGNTIAQKKIQRLLQRLLIRIHKSLAQKDEISVKPIEIPKEKHISPERWQKFNNKLRIFQL